MFLSPTPQYSELGPELVTDVSSLLSLFSPPNNYPSSILWALVLGQSPGIHWNADARMSEPRGSLRNMDQSMLINTLPYNCWWLLELSDKSYDSISPSWAQRWLRRHIMIEESHNFWCWLQCPPLANGYMTEDKKWSWQAGIMGPKLQNVI